MGYYKLSTSERVNNADLSQPPLPITPLYTEREAESSEHRKTTMRFVGCFVRSSSRRPRTNAQRLCHVFSSERRRSFQRSILSSVSLCAVTGFPSASVGASCDSSLYRRHSPSLRMRTAPNRRSTDLLCSEMLGAMDTRACTHTASSEQPY